MQYIDHSEHGQTVGPIALAASLVFYLRSYMQRGALLILNPSCNPLLAAGLAQAWRLL